MRIKNTIKKGFTLIEILVVVALIAILATITFVAINAPKSFQDTRNAVRQSDASALLDAISHYLVEPGNSVSTLETGAGTTIPTCSTYKNIGTGSGNVNLGAVLVDNYIASIPTDPSNGTAADTQYQICKSANGRVTINAAGAEGKTITIKR